VPTKNKSHAPPRAQSVERRGELRPDGAATDWETIVLKRVKRHVESLSTDTASSPGTPDASGWEQTALLALRRHIRDRKSD
jgi:hypothetical protein